jgi:hypothetical protein
MEQEVVQRSDLFRISRRPDKPCRCGHVAGVLAPRLRDSAQKGVVEIDMIEAYGHDHVIAAQLAPRKQERQRIREVSRLVAGLSDIQTDFIHLVA